MEFDRMYKYELEREIEIQKKRLDRALKEIDKIHGTKDYSDEIAKHFHLGLVGFRPDTKRANQAIDMSVKNAVAVCDQYGIRDNARGIMAYCQQMIDYIIAKAPNGDIENYTKHMIWESQKQAALSFSPAIQWEKSKGHYGIQYKHSEFEIEKIDSDFVIIRRNGENLTHCKTIKEAKSTVSLILSKAQ